MTIFNNHASVVFPFYREANGVPIIFWERKDPNFGAFPHGLCAIGGNHNKGIDADASPDDTFVRDTARDFWMFKGVQTLTSEALLGGHDPAELSDLTDFPHDANTLGRVQDIGRILTRGRGNVGTYAVQHHAPVTDRDDFYCLHTAYTRELTRGEFGYIQETLGLDSLPAFGQVTRDNQYGGNLMGLNVGVINSDEMLVSWGWEQVVNDLLQQGVFTGGEAYEGPFIKTVRPTTTVAKFDYDGPISKLGAPTYAGVEEVGHAYIDRSPPPAQE